MKYHLSFLYPTNPFCQKKRFIKYGTADLKIDNLPVNGGHDESQKESVCTYNHPNTINKLLDD